MRILEYIIRATDKTKEGTESAKKNVDDMSDGVTGAASGAGDAMSMLAAKAALVVTAFKLGWDIGERINDWISPTHRLAAAWERVKAAVQATKAYIKEAVSDFKEETADSDTGYADRERAVKDFYDGKIKLGRAEGEMSKSDEIAMERDKAAELLDIYKEQAQEKQRILDEQLAAGRAELKKFNEEEKRHVGKKFMGRDLQGIAVYSEETPEDAILRRETQTRDLKAAAAKINLAQRAVREADAAAKNQATELDALELERERTIEKERQKNREAELKQTRSNLQEQYEGQEKVLKRAEAAAKLAWNEYKDPALRDARKAAEESEKTSRSDYQDELKGIKGRFSGPGNVLDNLTEKQYGNLSDAEQRAMDVYRSEKGLDSAKKAADATLEAIKDNTRQMADTLAGRLTVK